MNSSEAHFAEEPTALQNLMAERSVLGTMLLHRDAVPEVTALLRPDDFSCPRHRLIYSALLHCFHDSGVTDPLVVRAELQRRDQLDDAGGFDQLLDLQELIVSAANVAMHAGMVAECARNRHAVEFAQVLTSQAKHGQLDVAAAVQHLQTLGGSVSAKATGPVVRDWREVATDPPVAYLLAGLIAKGADHVLGGTPGAGKSCIAAGIALAAAHGQGFLGVDLRRPFSSLCLCGEGMAGNGARLRAWQAANPSALLAPGQFFAFVDGVPNLLEPGHATGFIDKAIAQCVEKYGHEPDLVVLDTLARATPGIEENDNGAMGGALSVLGDVRRRHGCATLAVHHLRKPSALSRRKLTPTDMLAELRGAGAIGGAVDVALFAVRDGEARYLSVGKSRDGQDGGTVPYEIRGVLTGQTGDGGTPEWGPIVVPAAPASLLSDDAARPTEQAEQAARLEADIEAVVAVVRKESRVHGSADTVSQLANLPRPRGRAAVSCALARELILATGKTSDRWYVMPGTRADDGLDRDGASSSEGTNPVAANSRRATRAALKGEPSAARVAAASVSGVLAPNGARRRETARVARPDAGRDEGQPSDPRGAAGRSLPQGGAA